MEHDLPYSFDLLYDIKTRSELMSTLFKLVIDTEDILETINDNEILFTKEEKESLLRINTAIERRITYGKGQ